MDTKSWQDQERFLTQPPATLYDMHRKTLKQLLYQNTGLSEKSGAAVFDCTIRRCLNKNGLHGRVDRRKKNPFYAATIKLPTCNMPNSI